MKIIKVFRSAVCILLIVILCCGLLSSCNTAKLEPISIAIVIGNHANQRKYEYSDSSVDTALNTAKKAFDNKDFVYDGKVSVITCDGSPHPIEILNSKGNPAKFAQDANSNTVKRERITGYAKLVWDFLGTDSTKARTSEVDILTALRVAKSAVDNGDPNHEKHIIVIDPGVATKGDIDWKIMEGLDNKKETDDFIAFLKNNKQLDLSGINVHWYGFAAVASEQKLESDAVDRLKTFWEDLLRACGATNIIINDNDQYVGTPNVHTEEDDGYPSVRSVTFGTATFGSEGRLDLPKVLFVADSDKLLDDEASVKAQMTKQVIAMQNFFSSKPNEKLYLLGTTATSKQGGDGSIHLSQLRANRLKKVLVSMGISEEKLVAVGVGARVPKELRIEENPNGVFDTNLAEANRKAAVYIWDSEELQKILDYKENRLLLP